MSYGDGLKKMRASLGLTQKKLEELTGIAASTICAYERGTKEPGMKNQKRIEDALGSPVTSGHKAYICPKCGNTDHVANAKYCMICGTKIKTETDILVEDLRAIITDIIPHAPESMKDKARDTVRAACRWIGAGGD